MTPQPVRIVLDDCHVSRGADMAQSGKEQARMEDLRCGSLFGVEGKTVLVTGGATGIGLMIASGFVANGAKVYVASRSKDACEAVARELTRHGPGTCHALSEVGSCGWPSRVAPTRRLTIRVPSGLDPPDAMRPP